MIEWVAVVLTAVSVWFYPAVSGWRRIAAPCLGVGGNMLFIVVFIPMEELSGGVVVINVGLALINCRNLYRALRERPG